MSEGRFVSTNSERFEAALGLLDEQNAQDPNQISSSAAGVTTARELAYANWVTDWVLRLAPMASEALRVAARGAHLCRWTIPREAYPLTRAGYLRWRQELKEMHAQKVGEILQSVGYPPEFVGRVQALVSKRNFPQDPESRVLEDALCLVFLERQFSELASKSTAEKMVNALQKSWKKMTPAAQAIAKTLQFGPREQALIDQALSSAATQVNQG